MEFQAVSGPKFTGPFSLNAGGIAIVCNVGRFWISLAVPEILAMKVRNGPKSTEILHVFGLQIFLRECSPNFLTCIIKLDGQGKARREAARRRNSECKINFNSRNSSRSNSSRPTAVQRAVIGRRRGALVDNRQRRRVRRRLNMSVINTGGGAHWTGGRRGALHTSCYLWAWPYVQTAKLWREKWDFFQSRM